MSQNITRTTNITRKSPFFELYSKTLIDVYNKNLKIKFSSYLYQVVLIIFNVNILFLFKHIFSAIFNHKPSQFSNTD